MGEEIDDVEYCNSVCATEVTGGQARCDAGSHHALISGFYSSKQAFTGGLTVRQWLSSKSYAEQFEFGIKVILMKW